MTNTKLHSSWPYFLLTALFGLVPVLNNKFPSAFFPVVPAGGVEVLSVMLGILAAVMGFSRGWARLQQNSSAKAYIRQAVEKRQTAVPDDASEVGQSGRIISRMVRNADMDLSEIGPDFSMVSLKKLQDAFGLLLEEIQNEEDALLRLGVVGTYLGETACRNCGWKWFFKMDPGLRQFSYIASVIQKDRAEADPYALAADWMTGQKGLGEVLKAVG